MPDDPTKGVKPDQLRALIEGMREDLQGRGIEPADLSRDQKEERWARMSPTEKGVSKLYHGFAQPLTEGLATGVAAIPELAGQLVQAIPGTDKGPDGNFLRRAGASIRGLAEPAESMMVGGEPTVDMGGVADLSRGLGDASTFLFGAGALRSVGVMGRASGALLGTARGAEAEFRRAEEAGKEGGDLWLAWTNGAVWGSTEAIGVGGMLSRLDSRTGGGLRRVLKEVAVEGFEEGSQEFGQTMGTEAVATFLLEYADDQEWGEILKAAQDGAAIGMVLGAGLGGGGSVLQERALAKSKKAYAAEVRVGLEWVADLVQDAPVVRGEAGEIAQVWLGEMGIDEFSMEGMGSATGPAAENLLRVARALGYPDARLEDIHLVDAGRPLGGTAFSKDGIILLDRNAGAELADEVAAHELFHWAAGAGTPAGREAARAAAANPGVAAVLEGAMEAYRADYQEFLGEDPFAGEVDPQRRLALLTEEGWARLAELMPQSLMASVQGTLPLDDRGLVKRKGMVAAIRDLFVRADRRLLNGEGLTTEDQAFLEAMQPFTKELERLKEMGATPDAIRQTLQVLRAAFLEASPRRIIELGADEPLYRPWDGPDEAWNQSAFAAAHPVGAPEEGKSEIPAPEEASSPRKDAEGSSTSGVATQTDEPSGVTEEPGTNQAAEDTDLAPGFGTARPTGPNGSGEMDTSHIRPATEMPSDEELEGADYIGGVYETHGAIVLGGGAAVIDGEERTAAYVERRPPHAPDAGDVIVWAKKPGTRDELDPIPMDRWRAALEPAQEAQKPDSGPDRISQTDTPAGFRKRAREQYDADEAGDSEYDPEILVERKDGYAHLHQNGLTQEGRDQWRVRTFPPEFYPHKDTDFENLDAAIRFATEGGVELLEREEFDRRNQEVAQARADWAHRKREEEDAERAAKAKEPAATEEEAAPDTRKAVESAVRRELEKDGTGGSFDGAVVTAAAKRIGRLWARVKKAPWSTLQDLQLKSQKGKAGEGELLRGVTRDLEILRAVGATQMLYDDQGYPFHAVAGVEAPVHLAPIEQREKEWGAAKVPEPSNPESPTRLRGADRDALLAAAKGALFRDSIAGGRSLGGGHGLVVADGPDGALSLTLWAGGEVGVRTRREGPDAHADALAEMGVNVYELLDRAALLEIVSQSNVDAADKALIVAPEVTVAEMPRTAPDMFGETEEKKGTRREVLEDEQAQGGLFQEDTGARGQTSLLDAEFQAEAAPRMFDGDEMIAAAEEDAAAEQQAFADAVRSEIKSEYPGIDDAAPHQEYDGLVRPAGGGLTIPLDKLAKHPKADRYVEPTIELIHGILRRQFGGAGWKGLRPSDAAGQRRSQVLALDKLMVLSAAQLKRIGKERAREFLVQMGMTETGAKEIFAESGQGERLLGLRRVYRAALAILETALDLAEGRFEDDQLPRMSEVWNVADQYLADRNGFNPIVHLKLAILDGKKGAVEQKKKAEKPVGEFPVGREVNLPGLGPSVVISSYFRSTPDGNRRSRTVPVVVLQSTGSNQLEQTFEGKKEIARLRAFAAKVETATEAAEDIEEVTEEVTPLNPLESIWDDPVALRAWANELRQEAETDRQDAHSSYTEALEAAEADPTTTKEAWDDIQAQRRYADETERRWRNIGKEVWKAENRAAELEPDPDPDPPTKPSKAQSRVNRSTAAIKAFNARGEKLASDPKSPFMVWLRAMGGVHDAQGDLSQFSSKEDKSVLKGAWGIPHPVQTKKGKGAAPDMLIRAMFDAGWFPEAAGGDVRDAEARLYEENPNPIDTIRDFLERNPSRSDLEGDIGPDSDQEERGWSLADVPTDQEIAVETFRLMDEHGKTFEEAVVAAEERIESMRHGTPTFYNEAGEGLFAVPRGQQPLIDVRSSGGGDFYVQRVGPNAGTPHKERQGPSDFAIATDREVLLPDYLYYVIQFLQPSLAARARGTAQQSIRKGDILEVIEDHFRNQAGRHAVPRDLWHGNMGGKRNQGSLFYVPPAFRKAMGVTGTNHPGQASFFPVYERPTSDRTEQDILFEDPAFLTLDPDAAGLEPAGAVLFDEWLADRQVAEEWAQSRAAILERELRATLGRRDVADVVREAFAGEPLRAMKQMDLAMHLYIDLGDRAGEEFAMFREELSGEQREVFHLSQSLPAPIREMADRIRAENHARGKELEKRGLIRQAIEDYTARVWQPREEGDPVGGNAKFSPTSPRFKARGYSSILEGWAKGRELAVPSAIDAQHLSRRQTAQAIYDRHLRDYGLKAKVFSPVQRMGYVALDHPGFKRWVHAGKAEPGTVYGEDVRVTEEGNLERRATIYAPKGLAKGLNNATGRMWEGDFMEALTTANANLKATILFTSLFHHQAFLRSYAFGTPIVDGLGDMSPRKAYGLGRAAIDAWTPELELLVRAGLTLDAGRDLEREHLKQKTAVGRILDKMGAVGAARNAVVAARDQQTAFLFNRLGPYLKAQTALLELRHLMHKHRAELEGGGVSVKELATIAANMANDDFGGLNLQRMGRNPKVQHLMRLLLLAPDWTESNVRSMYKAFTRGREGQAYRDMWKRVGARAGLLTVLANLIMAGLDDEEDDPAGRSFLSRQKASWKAGNLRFLEVDITPMARAFGGSRDQRYYFSILGHFRDPVKFLLHPVTSLKHKGSPVLAIGQEALTGTDWAGRPFTSFDELAGFDDKGLYKASRMRADGTFTYPGMERGGQMRGQTVKWSGRRGPLEYKQIPSYLLSQLAGMMPIQVQNLMGWSTGEIDAFSAVAKSFGFMAASTRPMTPDEHIQDLRTQMGNTADTDRKIELLEEIGLWTAILSRRNSK